jgi:rhodanese-related sulfurtransferase
LAAYLFDSLRNKIMPLADNLIVFPSHGAGSACGKNMSKETTDTLGNQKKTNYALRVDMTKDEFIKELLDGLGLPPAYFPQNVMLNIKGYDSLDSIIKKSNIGLTPKEFEADANQGDVVVLDVRHENDFVKAHIPNSIFIGIQGNFAPWVGSMLRDVNQKLLLVIPEGKEEETIMRLSRVGFDHVLGYLKDGIEAWKEAGFETDSIHTISPSAFANKLNAKSVVVDARKPSEYEAEHVENAINIPLDTINENFQSIPKGDDFFLHCAGGYRSVIMASILKSRGIHNLINIEKGMSGIKQTSVSCTKFVCPSTKK